MIVVKKFGGSSLATIKNIKKVANFIKNCGDKNIIVVVSAMGKTTNSLLSKAKEISPKYQNKREIDQLLSTGEMVSASLLSLRLNEIGVSAISLSGGQAGIKTNKQYGKAFIKSIDIKNIMAQLKANKVVVVAGFQGINACGDITTLGRGGSDTTAVALASALKAKCEIYSDIKGIYSCDPRYYKSRKLLKNIDYDTMLEMAHNGTKAMEVRAVEIAKKYNTEIYLSKSLNMDKNKGTYISNFENVEIKGLSVKENLSFIKISTQRDEEKKQSVLSKLLNLNCTLESFKKMQINSKIEYTFCIENSKVDELKSLFKGKRLKIQKLSKITLIGCGIATHPKLILKIEKALKNKSIEKKNIDVSELSISLFIDNVDLLKAVRILAKIFKL